MELTRQQALLEEIKKRIQSMEVNDKLSKDRMRESRAENTLSEESRAKRCRRTAEMIEKKHRCHAPLCGKSYGAEGSLQQHIKLKHP